MSSIIEVHLEGVGEEGRSRLLVKVDVEGRENDLIAASADLVRTDRPTFLIEILPGADVSRLVEVFGRQGLGYRYYLVAEDRLREHRTLSGVDTYRDWLITILAPQALTCIGIPTEELH